MITEDYVSFETAKLLKEKGFNEECEYFYDEYENEYVICSNGGSAYNDDKHPTYYSMPTLQMAMKWLRNVHDLSVEIYRTACGYISCIVAIPSGTDIKFLEEDGDDLPSGQYTTWDKACEAAIKYCLENLI